ncbi:MAG TPA: spore coat U domain-containing protein [Nevskiaceae bacterium]|nr:spore coat U domain-containing protein [Nevskiaceae bacterium]
MKSVRAALLLACLCAVQPDSWASCSASSQSVPFPGYNPFDLTADDATGNVHVSCTGIGLLVSYHISLSTGASGSFTTRTMKQASATLNYNLYTNLLRVTIWGDGSGSSSKVDDGYLIQLGTIDRDYTVYGRVFAQQNAAPGPYSDTILVTVDY